MFSFIFVWSLKNTKKKFFFSKIWSFYKIKTIFLRELSSSMLSHYHIRNPLIKSNKKKKTLKSMPLGFIARNTLFLDIYQCFPIFFGKKLFQKFFFSKFCWAHFNYLENKPKYVKKVFYRQLKFFLALKNVFFQNTTFIE